MGKKYLVKVLTHVGGISSFLVGANLVHVAHNSPFGSLFDFFGLKFKRIEVFDTGLVLMGIGFFIEFISSFKPLEVKR